MCCISSQLLCCCICQGQQWYICEHVEYVPVQREYTAVFDLLYTVTICAMHGTMKL